MHAPSPTAPPAGNPLQLALGTGAFALCFAVFGSVSAMMPILRERLQLGPLEVSVGLAIPVLLGSLGRIPLGILTDQYGGRVVFMAVMAFSILPAVLMGWVENTGSWWCWASSLAWRWPVSPLASDL
jgi:MFS transporter, NNP family, nitrate/nitrite transporter